MIVHSRTIKIMIMLTICVIFSFFVILTIPKFRVTFFSIFPQPEKIELPLIDEGREITQFGVKYANHSSVLVITDSLVSCSWKPDHLDDGFKTCEAIFEIENFNLEKPRIRAPHISLDFSKQDISNIQLSYSTVFDVVEEKISNLSTEVVNVSVALTSNASGSQFISAQPGIIGQAIAEVSLDDQITNSSGPSRVSDKNHTKVIVHHEEVIFLKREFEDFKSVTLSVNTTKQNKALNSTAPAINISEEIVYNASARNEAGTQNQSSSNYTSETSSEENESLKSVQDSEDSLIKNQSDVGLIESNTSTVGSNSTVESNASIGSEVLESNTSKVVQSNNEVKSSGSLNSSRQESESVSAAVSAQNAVNESPRTLIEGSLEPSTHNNSESHRGLTGRIISVLTEESEVELPTAKPFAIKIVYEAPKYSSNQFNFNLTADNFHAFIDPDQSSCGTLGAANSIYTLTQNVTSSGSCFTISANNITLDCQYNAITFGTGGSGGRGIDVSGVNNSKIKNCFIMDGNVSSSGDYSIYLSDSTNHAVDNNSIEKTSGSGFGIFLTESSHNTIYNNTVTSSGTNTHALYLQSNASNNTVTQNTVNTSTQSVAGIHLAASENSLVDNTIEANASGTYGITLDSFDNAVISNNTILTFGSSGYGIYVNNNNGLNNITNNSIRTLGSGGYGVHLIRVNNTRIERNNITTLESTASGVLLDSGSLQNTINNNTIFAQGSDAHGVYLASLSDYANVTNNTISITGASGYGIYLETSSFAHIQDNSVTTTGNDSFGIYLYTNADNNSLAGNSLATHGDRAHGLYADLSLGSIANTTTISTAGDSAYGIYLDGISESSIENSNVHTNNSNAHALYFRQSYHNLTVIDTVLNASNTNAHDVVVNSPVSGGVWNFTNVTFSKRNWSEGANGSLTSWQYLSVNVNDTQNSVLSSINVSIFDGDGNVIISELTNAQGSLSRKLLREFEQSSFTSFINYSNYTLKATRPDNVTSLTRALTLGNNGKLLFMFLIEILSSPVSVQGGGAGGGSCISAWDCTPWSQCQNNVQTRSCTPVNPACATGKPVEQRGCSDQSRRVLFDVSLQLLEEVVEINGKVRAVLRLVNLGDPGSVNVTLIYKIIDIQRNVVYNSSESIPVETQKEFIKEFDLSQLSQGEYSLFVDLVYEGQREPAQAESQFVINLSQKKATPSLVLQSGVVVIIAILCGLGVYFMKKKKILARKKVTQSIRKQHAQPLPSSSKDLAIQDLSDESATFYKPHKYS